MEEKSEPALCLKYVLKACAHFAVAAQHMWSCRSAEACEKSEIARGRGAAEVGEKE